MSDLSLWGKLSCIYQFLFLTRSSRRFLFSLRWLWDPSSHWWPSFCKFSILPKIFQCPRLTVTNMRSSFNKNYSRDCWRVGLSCPLHRVDPSTGTDCDGINRLWRDETTSCPSRELFLGLPWYYLARFIRNSRTPSVLSSLLNVIST